MPKQVGILTRNNSDGHGIPMVRFATSGNPRGRVVGREVANTDEGHGVNQIEIVDPENYFETDDEFPSSDEGHGLELLKYIDPPIMTTYQDKLAEYNRVVHYKMDQASGNLIDDVAGLVAVKNGTATVTYGIAPLVADDGFGISIQNSGDFRVADVDAPNLPTTFTMIGWFKAGTSSGGYAFRIGSGLYFGWSSNDVYALVGGQEVSEYNSQGNGTIHMGALVVDAGVATVYRNGVAVASAAIADPTTSGILYVATSGSGTREYDDFVWINEALTAPQLLELYSLGS